LETSYSSQPLSTDQITCPDWQASDLPAYATIRRVFDNLVTND